MPDQWAVVEFTTPASAPSTLNITSPDITEDVKAVILLWGNSTNDDTDENPARAGMAIVSIEGVDSGIPGNIGGAVCAQIRSGAGVGVQDPDGLEGDNAAVILPTNASTGNDIISVVASAIPGGVSLSFTTVAAQVKGKAILLAGSAMRSWGGSLAISSTTPVQQDTGGAGTEFQPDLLIALPSRNSSDSPTRVANQTYIGIGGAVAGTIQKASMANWAAGEPSDADGILRSTQIVCGLTAVGRTEIGMTAAINSTGFTYAGVNATAVNMRYLAIKFGGPFQVGVANMPIAGSTGAQDFDDLGMQPSLVLGASFLLAAEDTLTDGATASAAGWFITGTKGSRAATIRAQENLTAVTHNPSCRQGDDALLTYDDLANVAQRASWAGSIPGGFQLNFSTATAGYMTAIGIHLGASHPIAGDPQRSSAPRQRRARRQVTGGILRASFYGRFLRALKRNRFMQMMRLRSEHQPAPPIEPVQSDPGLVRGDNALASSRKGGNALASSTLGDTR